MLQLVQKSLTTELDTSKFYIRRMGIALRGGIQIINPFIVSEWGRGGEEISVPQSLER